MKMPAAAVLLCSLLTWGCVEFGNLRAVEYDSFLLHHGRGEISMRKSALFDTLYQWTHFGDCDCCHLHKTRSSRSGFPVLKESGWKYAQPDSCFQMTIIQTEKPGCDPGFTLDRRQMKAQIDYLESTYWSDIRWRYREITRVDGLDFLILGGEIKSSARYDQQNIQRLLSFALIDGELVTIDFECRKKDCGAFLKNAYHLVTQARVRQVRQQ